MLCNKITHLHLSFSGKFSPPQLLASRPLLQPASIDIMACNNVKCYTAILDNTVI